MSVELDLMLRVVIQVDPQDPRKGGGGNLAVKENLGHVFSLQDLSNIDALLRESRERGLNCISDF